MKQISTGAGLVALSVGMVATAFIATHRSGGEAFAQGTETEPRIVAAGVYTGGNPWNGSYGSGSEGHFAYRIWSDNSVQVKWLGVAIGTFDSQTGVTTVQVARQNLVQSFWHTVDDGTVAFRPTDIDRSGQIDSGDIAQVLLDFNETVDQTTPPPIDCNINAPR